MGFRKIILRSYLSSQVVRSFLGISVILIIVLSGNQFFVVLNQSLNQGLYSSEIFPLILFKIIRDLPFIIGFAFIVGLTYSLNKLYKNSEAIFINSIGLGDLKIFQLLLPVVLYTSLFLLILSLFVVPLANQKIQSLKEEASSRPSYIFFKEGVFQEFNKNNLTSFILNIENNNSNDNQNLYEIFLYSSLNDRLILAQSGEKNIEPESGDVNLKLQNGKIFEGLSESYDRSSITNFSEYSILLLESNSKTVLTDETEALSVNELLKSTNNNDKGELLSRFLYPISIIFLAAIAISFSRTSPRKKSNFALAYSSISYLIFYNLSIFIKTNFELEKSDNLLIFFVPNAIILILFIYFFFLKNFITNKHVFKTI